MHATHERLRWLGDCNGCGQCCAIHVKHNGRALTLVCEHLRANLSGGKALPLGTPMATRCGVYEQRVDGMKIRMLDGKGEALVVTECHKNCAVEDDLILANLHRGCSLTLGNPADVPLGTFIPSASSR